MITDLALGLALAGLAAGGAAWCGLVIVLRRVRRADAAAKRLREIAGEHVHDLRPVAARIVESIADTFGGAGSTVVLFACDCQSGHGAVDAKMLIGRWSLPEITGQVILADLGTQPRTEQREQ